MAQDLRFRVYSSRFRVKEGKAGVGFKMYVP